MPLDLTAVPLSEKMKELVEQLAENTHRVWASERIKAGWTYGLHDVSADDPPAKNSDKISIAIIAKIVARRSFYTAKPCTKYALVYTPTYRSFCTVGRLPQAHPALGTVRQSGHLHQDLEPRNGD